MSRNKKFKKGDLVRFVDIPTSIDTLPPTGYPKLSNYHWSKLLDAENYDAKESDIGVVVVPHRKNLNVAYTQVLVNGKLFWFDSDNLEILVVYSADQ